ncbi:hypothetical protein [Leisingera sp. NJS204]|uniref:hypothetical protein n=1 Tax=Leisingera sp. NJS204 TaxID=2508307 RepID=UPI0010117736|nr:hypothetical protein [Leisingera sp. NJS204]QAX29845.1 hypothetical protein ETW24_10935 [Leisingera sp. NJS204]
MSLPACSILALVLTLTGAGALAETSFRCNLKPISGVTWVPGRITVHFSDDFTTAKVTDAAFGVSVSAKVSQRSETTYAISWSLPGLAVLTDSGQAKPRFRAVLNTANLKMSIQSTRTSGTKQPPRGSGTCRREPSLSRLAQNHIGWN